MLSILRSSFLSTHQLFRWYSSRRSLPRSVQRSGDTQSFYRSASPDAQSTSHKIHFERDGSGCLGIWFPAFAALRTVDVSTHSARPAHIVGGGLDRHPDFPRDLEKS